MNRLIDRFRYLKPEPYGYGIFVEDSYYYKVRWKIDNVRSHMRQPLFYYLEDRAAPVGGLGHAI